MQRSSLAKVLRVLAGILVVIVVVSKVHLWRGYQHRSRASDDIIRAIPKDATLDTKMRGLGEAAAALGREYGTECNYSSESFAKVDEMLAKVTARTTPQNRDEAVATGCLMWGAYVGEVIRKQHKGGSWSEGKDETGHGKYPLEVNGQVIYPCLWCVESVNGGVSVSQQYQAFALNSVIQQGLLTSHGTSNLPKAPAQ